MGIIASCYQKLNMLQFGGAANLLNLGGTINYRFTDFGMPPHFTLQTKFVRIEIFDGTVFKDINEVGLGWTLEDDDFEWVPTTVGGNTFPVITIKMNVTGGYEINPNTFTFGNFNQARLTLFDNLNTGGIGTFQANLINTVQEAFPMIPSGNAICYTFTPFSYNISSILDGLCSSNMNINFRLPAGSPHAGYFPPNWNVQQSLSNNGSRIDNFNIPNSTWCDQCLNVVAPHYLPDPVPCGCMEIEVMISIAPCSNSPSGCPTLELAFPIEVCCDCDVRLAPPND